MSRKTPGNLQTANDIEELPQVHVSHPLNENSDVFLKRLSPEVGLERLALYIARVPPGKESFAYHRHERNEEFIYVLSGRGIAHIGDEEIEVGPGDFMGFPAPEGPAHHLINPFDEDLVYLMGGESSGLDIGYFPKLNRRIVFSESGMILAEDHDCQNMSFDQWMVKDE